MCSPQTTMASSPSPMEMDVKQVIQDLSSAGCAIQTIIDQPETVATESICSTLSTLLNEVYRGVDPL